MIQDSVLVCSPVPRIPHTAQIERLAHQKVHPTPTPTGHPLPGFRLRSLHNSTPTLPFQFENDNITSATLNQDDIGWYPFLLGHLLHYWQAIQHDYFVSLGLRNTGVKWTAQLIIKLFNTSWDMWEHRNGRKHNTLMPAKL
jgi:hypothetical protein